MSYESPIEINYGEMQTEYENGILKAVWKYDIHCDKEELLKALAYDRDQYRKGYEDAKPRWIPCEERLPEDGNTTYMVTVDYGEFGGGTGQRFYYGKDIGWDDDAVVAWMPLPKPYEGRTE